MALFQPRRTPTNLAAQYLTPQASTSPARDAEELTDSDDKEIDGLEENHELLSDSDMEDEQTQAQDEEYVEGAENDELRIRTPVPAATAAPTPGGRPLVLVPEEVACVCAHRATQGRLRVGRCPSCSGLFHLACQARNSAAQSGWVCLDCTGASLQTVTYDTRKLTYVYEHELLGTALPPPATTALPTEALSAQDVEHEIVDGILCICPNRAMKVRTRLAKCRKCKLIAHIPCRVRNAANVPGFICWICPDGRLEYVPDLISDTTTPKKITPKRTPARPHPEHRITKATPSTTTRKTMRLTAGKTSQHRVAQQSPDIIPDTTPDEPSLRRHNLRQKNVPNMKDRPSRAPRKPRVIEPQSSPRLDDMDQRLVRVSEQVVKTPREPRTSNLHEIFLRNISADALWRHYCILPDGTATNADVLRATELNFVKYQVEPVVAVPDAWSRELKYRLGLLLDAATSDGQKIRLSTKQWENDVGLALRHVRDIAMEVLHHGSYKGKRARLGLLAELLGLSDKGTFWKGGDRFVADKTSRREQRGTLLQPGL